MSGESAILTSENVISTERDLASQRNNFICLEPETVTSFVKLAPGNTFEAEQILEAL